MKSCKAAITPWLLLAGLVSGCCPNGALSGSDPFRLNPATIPMSAVIAAINANNRRIPTLWATLNYSVAIVDHGKVHSVASDDATLLYMRPHDFRLNGKKEFIGTVFDMGANDSEYWIEVVPGASTLWRGKFSDLSRMGPAQLPIDIRPDQVGEVLAVDVMDEDLLAQPTPVMRYDGPSDSYVFLFSRRARDRWFAWKQVSYDRSTLRPRQVILYDADGRPVLIARLSGDVRVQTPDAPPAQWPIMAGDFRLFFPDYGSRMEFSVKDVRLYKDLGRGRRAPAERSFQVPDVSGTDVRMQQIGGSGN